MACVCERDTLHGWRPLCLITRGGTGTDMSQWIPKAPYRFKLSSMRFRNCPNYNCQYYIIQLCRMRDSLSGTRVSLRSTRGVIYIIPFSLRSASDSIRILGGLSECFYGCLLFFPTSDSISGAFAASSIICESDWSERYRYRPDRIIHGHKNRKILLLTLVAIFLCRWRLRACRYLVRLHRFRYDP